jgi:protein-disulfide isomerase
MIRAPGLFAALALSLLLPSAVLAQTLPTPAAISAARDGDRSVGSPVAPVTLTAYVSTTCSHCADWHNNVLPAFKARYVDTGQVRIVYRDLLTSPQEVAAGGALMAHCVPDDRFDAAMNALFRNQATLLAATPEERQDKATQWLASAGVSGGLTREQMSACFASDANWAALDARLLASQTDGVTGTPTFFVNGERANIDPHALSSFDTVLQPLLAAH